ncbi:MAG: hypothetical protein ACP5NX_04635 [Candidatus Bilamarchaeaceae archaeon]
MSVRNVKLKPLGNHTAIGLLNEAGNANKVPYLKDNAGLLPPFMIAVGSRVRVEKSVNFLGLKNAVLIDQYAKRKFGLDSSGRVSVLVGVYRPGKGPGMPVSIVETQMGCPATQINIKEALYFSSHDGYTLGRRKYESDAVYVVRAGTCAGVNSRNRSEVALDIGDIAITSETYGSIGAIFQSSLESVHFLGDLRDAFDRLRVPLMENQLVDISHDGRTLKTFSSPRLLFRLQRSADSLGLVNLVGANFSKDSLYGELGEDGFAALRDSYGVVSTEMEQAIINVLAREFTREGIPVHSGLVSAVIGAIPGKSFYDTPEEKARALKAEENAMLIAANALYSIFKDLN